MTFPIPFDHYMKTLYPDLVAAVDEAGDDGALPEFPATPREIVRVIRSLPIVRHERGVAGVILAAGKGSRMGEGVKQKSLCPINGKPALLHLIETCAARGITDFVVIVGHGYRHVMQAVDGLPYRFSFLFQDRILGTGHAARLAARFLRLQQFDGGVLMLMGDKWVSPFALERLTTEHHDSKADMTLTAERKGGWEDAGRLVMDEQGGVAAIIEKPDIIQRQVMCDFLEWECDPVPCDAFLRHALALWNRPNKLRMVLGDAFWEQLNTLPSLAKRDAALPLSQQQLPFIFSNGVKRSAKEVEELCEWTNLSIYLFTAAAFYESMEALKPGNAQGELYLTDAVSYLAAKPDAKVAAALMDEPHSILGFNTPDELARVEGLVVRVHAC